VSSSRTKPVKPEVSSVSDPALTPEELKVIEEYRAGRLQATQGKVVDTEDLKALNMLDEQVKGILHEVGLVEERKMNLLAALDGTRKQKNSFLQEVMLRYGIPANQSFRINRETGAVSIEDNAE